MWSKRRLMAFLMAFSVTCASARQEESVPPASTEQHCTSAISGPSVELRRYARVQEGGTRYESRARVRFRYFRSLVLMNNAFPSHARCM